jgi:imidazolonepropionase-like amidohydrolase
MKAATVATFKASLDLPSGLTEGIRERLLSDFERALDDGGWAAHEFIMRGILKRGLTAIPSVAASWADHLQHLAARVRIERGIAQPGQRAPSRPSRAPRPRVHRAKRKKLMADFG